MKSFLKYFCIFVFATILFAVGLDIFISRRLFFNTNRMYVSWNQIYHDTTNYDLIINGNSRAWVQFNPRILDSIIGVNSYNLGMDGSAVNRQIIKYNKYCQLHIRPKYVIWNIDIFTLAITKGYEREQFFPYFVYDRDLITEYDRFELFDWKEKYIPCFRYIGYYDVLLESFLHDNHFHAFEPLYKGYHAQDRKWDGSQLKTKKSMAFTCDSVAAKMLKQIVEYETNNGVKIIFVYAPMHVSVWDKVENVNSMYMEYDSIASLYHVPILRYDTLPMCADTSFFYNATHLNHLGADIFSVRLASDLKNMGFMP